MSNDIEAASVNSVIRLGRSGRLSWGVALALSLTLVLNGFILVGWVTNHADVPVPLAYLLSMVLFLPVALTYAERAMATRDRAGRGILALFQAEGTSFRRFAAGWLLLLGYVGLAALLGCGLGFYVGLLAQTWFGLTLDLRWLALLVLLLASLGPLSGTLGIGSLRAKLVYVSLAVVVGIAVWAWFNPPGVLPAGEKEMTGLWRVVAFLSPGLWSIGLLLCYRRQMRHPRKSWFPALLILVVCGGLLGTLVSAVEGYPHLWAGSLDSPSLPASSLLPPFLETVFVFAGLFAGFVALSATLSSSWRLVEAMAAQGFLPGHASRTDSRLGLRVMMGLMLVAVGVALVLMPIWMAMGLAGLSFLWVTVLLNVSDAVRLGGRASPRRPFQLPFHPLFPGLAMLVGIFVPLALPLPVLLVGGGVAAAGCRLLCRLCPVAQCCRPRGSHGGQRESPGGAAGTDPGDGRPHRSLHIDPPRAGWGETGRDPRRPPDRPAGPAHVRAHPPGHEAVPGAAAVGDG